MRIKRISVMTAICISVILLSVCFVGCKEAVPIHLSQGNTVDVAVSDIELFGPYSVVRVVDGDTVVLNIDGTDTKVRLIGVDTPESVATGANSYKNCEEGKLASEYTKSVLGNQQVYLEYDVSPADKYGRTLAYVYLKDKTTMLNRMLLEKGYAKTMTIPPNVRYADNFLEIQRGAESSGVGFWSGYFGTSLLSKHAGM